MVPLSEALQTHPQTSTILNTHYISDTTVNPQGHSSVAQKQFQLLSPNDHKISSTLAKTCCITPTCLVANNWTFAIFVVASKTLRKDQGKKTTRLQKGGRNCDWNMPKGRI